MNTTLKIDFDMDDEDEAEKFEKISNILMDKEECTADYEAIVDSTVNFLEEKRSEFKPGSVGYKIIVEIEEFVSDSKLENGVEVED